MPVLSVHDVLIQDFDSDFINRCRQFDLDQDTLLIVTSMEAAEHLYRATNGAFAIFLVHECPPQEMPIPSSILSFLHSPLPSSTAHIAISHQMLVAAVS